MRTHGIKLSKNEQTLLDDSYNDSVGSRRMLFVCINVTLAIGAILGLLFWNISPRITSVVFVVYVLVSAVEKFSYTQVIDGYKALVRTFVARAEDLYHHPEQIVEEHAIEATR